MNKEDLKLGLGFIAILCTFFIPFRTLLSVYVNYFSVAFAPLSALCLMMNV
jgi:hypothetical protein